FVTVRLAKVDVIKMAPHLVELTFLNARRDAVVGAETQFLLRFGQGQPQASPGTEFMLGAPQARHFPAGITTHQGIIVDFVLAHLEVFRSEFDPPGPPWGIKNASQKQSPRYAQIRAFFMFFSAGVLPA